MDMCALVPGVHQEMSADKCSQCGLINRETAGDCLCDLCQVYTRKNLLTSANKAAWSTGTYEGNRKRPLKGHELFAQVRPGMDRCSPLPPHT